MWTVFAIAANRAPIEVFDNAWDQVLVILTKSSRDIQVGVTQSLVQLSTMITTTKRYSELKAPSVDQLLKHCENYRTQQEFMFSLLYLPQLFYRLLIHAQKVEASQGLPYQSHFSLVTYQFLEVFARFWSTLVDKLSSDSPNLPAATYETSLVLSEFSTFKPEETRAWLVSCGLFEEGLTIDKVIQDDENIRAAIMYSIPNRHFIPLCFLTDPEFERFADLILEQLSFEPWQYLYFWNVKDPICNLTGFPMHQYWACEARNRILRSTSLAEIVFGIRILSYHYRLGEVGDMRFDNDSTETAIMMNFINILKDRPDPRSSLSVILEAVSLGAAISKMT
ncbi:hypothetical protein BX600DRAFT_440162 [Xylariales sp. PMI_506]|nr:hypothetical protein BX600DRAFT_440162 [Xylariales sp. PMI_506]